MDYSVKWAALIQIEKKKWLFLVALVALTHLFCQSLMLPNGSALLSMLPDAMNNEIVKEIESSKQSYVKAVIVEDLFMGVTSNLDNESQLVPKSKSNLSYKLAGNNEDYKEGPSEKDKEIRMKVFRDTSEKDDDDDDDFVEDENLDGKNVDIEELSAMQNDSLLQKMGRESSLSFSLSGFAKESSGDAYAKKIRLPATNSSSGILSPTVFAPAIISLVDVAVTNSFKINGSTTSSSVVDVSSDETKEKVGAEDHLVLESSFSALSNGSIHAPAKKKMRCEMPPKTVTTLEEMQRLLVRNRARSRATRPEWHSVRDQEILTAKSKIENAPVLTNDQELYVPLYRNISMFKRSYELMERVLKIYVYKDGEKPIFHQPVLKGLYASEGWFMKLMEGNKNFVVKDPRKAHLFYMPFSSRMLEHAIYVRNSHNRTNLRQYLKNYSEKIAAKYRMWNRTGGADHFLVACHDWAPYETRHHMEHCIKALCNADVTVGFKIGRDVSLPETYVRSARNPLRDLGGKPPSQRDILAFYAGSMHGYLRPILLEYWKDKEPDMKIFSRMPLGVASKMNYIQHMKSSKYCICPKGYEVNSPRVVEAIFYECVPVIISDNFVPPFFEVLNWDAFSVIIAEKDIPDLRNILVSIPEEKYLKMQLGVRKVQQHFLWHAKPLKYDLFHMTLHSIWYNRVFQTKLR